MKDMTKPNWTRTLKKLRRYAAELDAYDWPAPEPPNMEIPPSLRSGRPPASGGIISAGQTYIVGEHGPEDSEATPGQRIKRRL